MTNARLYLHLCNDPVGCSALNSAITYHGFPGSRRKIQALPPAPLRTFAGCGRIIHGFAAFEVYCTVQQISQLIDFLFLIHPFVFFLSGSSRYAKAAAIRVGFWAHVKLLSSRCQHCVGLFCGFVAAHRHVGILIGASRTILSAETRNTIVLNCDCDCIQYNIGLQ